MNKIQFDSEGHLEEFLYEIVIQKTLLSDTIKKTIENAKKLGYVKKI